MENGQLRYTPDSGFTGTDSGTYGAIAGESTTEYGTVVTTVEPDFSSGGRTPLRDQTSTVAPDTYTQTTGGGSYTIFDWDNQGNIDPLNFIDLNIDDVSFAQTALWLQ